MLSKLLSATALFALGLSASTYAIPYYVGDNPTPENSIFLGLHDAPTDRTGAGTGNIFAMDLNAYAGLNNDMLVRGSFPFYFASKSATDNNQSRNNVGNLLLGVNYNKSLSETTDRIRFGIMGELDAYAPTSRKAESISVAFANPTTNFYSYYPSATTLTPKVGFVVSQNFWSAKTNAGYAYSYVDRKGIAGTDQHRNSFIWQLGGSIHPTESINLNLEYNTIYLDARSATQTNPARTALVKRAQFRHAIAPSVSGRLGPAVGNLYVSFPLDKPTRDLSVVAFGMNAGVTF